MLNAVKFSRDIELQIIILEGDAEHDWIDCHKYKLCIKYYTSYKIFHMKREANVATHKLAKVAVHWIIDQV